MFSKILRVALLGHISLRTRCSRPLVGSNGDTYVELSSCQYILRTWYSIDIRGFSEQKRNMLYHICLPYYDCILIPRQCMQTSLFFGSTSVELY